MKRIFLLLIIYSGIVSGQTSDTLLTDLNRQLEDDSTNVEVLIQRATHFYELYEFDKALTDITQSKLYVSNDPYVYYLSGLIHNDLSNYLSALDDINKAIELNPSPVFFQARAMTYLSMGKYEEAVRDSYQFKEMEELSMSFFLVQVIANQKMGKLDESIMICQEAIERYSDFSEIYNLLSRSYNLKGNDQAAMEAIEKAIQLAPDIEYYYQTKANLEIKTIINEEVTIESPEKKWRYNDINLENYDGFDKLVKKRKKKYYFESLREKYKRDYTDLTLDECFMLYYGFSSHKRYSPYFGSTDDEITNLRNSLYQGDYKQVIKNAEIILEKDLSQLEAYLLLARAYLYTGNKDKAYENYYKYTVFLESIIATGDGRSFDSPFIVINIHDEYVIMNYLGITSNSQSLNNMGEHTYDVHQYYKDMQDGEMYFLIDKPFSSMGKVF